ncbi:MAG: hypothetical protein U0R44_04785 [Candidatus Micrarchaeia archaeon]
MRGALIVLLLVAGLLIFGCAGGTKEANNTTVKSNETVPPKGLPANGSGGDQNVPPRPTTPPENVTGSGGTGTGSSGGNDLSGKGYAALLALGIPVQCDVTSVYKNKTTNMKMYMNGKGVSRVEVPDSSSGQCTNSVMVTKDKQLYMGCSDGQLFSGCDWMLLELEPTSGAPAGGAGSSAPDLKTMPATDFNCAPWVMDPSKFETPGKVCSFKDIMGGSGYP